MMRGSGLAPRALSLLLVGAVLSIGTDSAQAGPPPPDAGPVGAPPPLVASSVAVRSSCPGQGRIDLQVRRHGDTYTITATARGLEPGSRWRVVLYEDGPAPGEETKDFRRVVARHGTWTRTTKVPTTIDPAFGVMAFTRAEGVLCSAMYDGTAKQFYGFGGCTNARRSFAAVNVFMRKGDPLVLFSAGNMKAHSRWRIAVDAMVDGVDRHRSDRVRADAHRQISGRAVFNGDSVSRVRVEASNRHGDRCVFAVGRKMAKPTVLS